MLMSLQIDNIAVIERSAIEFDAGFNVLTGETGAGKSIVIDSINAVLGERVNRELVRTGSSQAEVTALFDGISDAVIQTLREMGVEPEEDGTLVIRRVITAEGKGSCRINGRTVTVSVLRDIGRLLVNIHGQHENQVLLAPEKHVEYLDRLGGLLPLRAVYEERYHRMCAVRAKLKEADMDETMKARRLDMLRYQIEEIERAKLKPGEEDELLAQRTVYRNAEKIADALYRAHMLLLGDEDTNGALGDLSEASEELSNAGRFMPEAEQLASQVESALCDLQECAGDLRGMTDQLEFDPADLDAIEGRLDTIHRVTTKYGPGVEASLAFLEKARKELEEIETSDEVIRRLTKELEGLRRETEAAAAELTKARQTAAVRFSKEVVEQLAFLDMPGVRLEVAVEPVALSAVGADPVEFLISANPGEPAKPIARIASGGELSRIMLAIKSVLADADDIDTLVFDEIDTGISGRAAQKVGIKLRETATSRVGGRGRQVLCVTHLAQIAAQAHNHLLIEKSVRDGRTYTDVRPLDRAGRERELARIIGGEVTEANCRAACEMLDRVEEQAVR